MKQTFHDKLRSPWVPIGFVVGVVALCAGLIYGMADSSGIIADDEWTPPTPSPPEGPPLSTEHALATMTARTGAATSSYVPPPSPTAISTAQAEYYAATPGKAVYFETIDKVLHLPDGVRLVGRFGPGGFDCAPSETYCPVLPLHELRTSDGKRVDIDDVGTIMRYWDPGAFPFLATVPYLKHEER